MKLKFKVDKDIMEGAVRGSTCECLVARALFREGVRNIRVDKTCIKGVINGKSIVCDVPPKIAQTIENFDAGKNAKQFSGTLNFGVKSTVKRKSAASTRTKKRAKKPGPKKGTSTWSNYRYQGVTQLINNEG